MWTPDFVREALMGAVRHALTTFAGMLVANGIIMGNQTNDFIGSGLFLAGVAWSWWQKHNQITKAASLARPAPLNGAPR